MRAIAILLVVFFHARWLFPSGFVGVDIFFVISGFVIFSLLTRQLESSRFSFRGFYRARLRRLAPAVGLLLVTVVLASFPLLSPIDSQRDTAVVAVGGATWTANIPIMFAFGGYFDPQAETNPLLHLWSLAVEEQFYLFMPLVVWGAWRAGRIRGAIVATLGVVAMSGALLAVLKVGLWSPPKSAQFAFFSSPTRAWEFALGGMAFLVADRWRQISGRAANLILAWSGAVALLVSGFWVGSEEQHPSWPVLLPVIGTCMVLLAGSARSENPVSRGLSWRPLTWLGDISYSWYLWHWPLIVFALLAFRSEAILPIVAFASIIPAFLSYRYLESPIRSGRRLASWGGFRVIVATSVPAILLAVALLFGWWNAWWSPAVEDFAGQVDPLPLGVAEGCQGEQPFSASRVTDCTWGADLKGSPVYLFGDSNAGMYSDGLAVAARDLQRPLVMLVSPGCEPVKVSIDRGQDERCASFVSGVLGFLESARPGTVVMASANGNARSPGATVSPDDWAMGIADAVTAIQTAGHKTVYMEQIPQFREEALNQWWHPGNCSLVRVASDAPSCGMTMNKDSTMQGPDGRSTELRGLLSVDVQPVPTVIELCDEETCSTNTGNYWRYRDGLHLSVAESLRFAPILEQALVTQAT